MKTKQLLLSLFILSIVFTSCSDNSEPEIIGDYQDGLIISAEGAWGAKDGSVSFVSKSLDSLPSKLYLRSC